MTVKNKLLSEVMKSVGIGSVGCVRYRQTNTIRTKVFKYITLMANDANGVLIEH